MYMYVHRKDGMERTKGTPCELCLLPQRLRHEYELILLEVELHQEREREA
jgi:hypothetical protein